MKFVSVILLALLCIPEVSTAQNRQEITITGALVSEENDESLFGVNVTATSLADTTKVYGSASERSGNFRVVVPARGSYRVRLTYIGFEEIIREIAITGINFGFGVIRMQRQPFDADQVVVEALADRVVVNGDTTEYRADAFKVNPDATAEDLVAKLPGVVVQDGEVQAQGETVQRVLVDGREFFGDDPNLALRTLPSEIIEKIQVFDRLSDQAQFTGFDDGNREMTMNIVTLRGRSNGQFGKVYGGYGSEERYISGGNVNIFDNDRRISIIGLSNNVNQQNFTTEDLLGVVGNAGRRSGMGGGFRARGGGGDGPPGGGRGGGAGLGGDGASARAGLMRGGGRSGSNPSNFLVGNQGGLSTTHAAGLNYTDNWGSKIAVSGSYFFNMADNTSDILLDRQYFLEDGAAQAYSETNNATSDNYNHRLTMRMTYTIDEANSIIFTPRISSQVNNSESYLFGINSLDGLSEISSTANNYLSENSGFTGSGNLLFRHRFPKQGRTISVNLGGGVNDRSGNSNQLSENVFMEELDADQFLDQRTDTGSSGYNISSNIAYTEPLGQGGQLQVNYRPAMSWDDSDRMVNSFDPVLGQYITLEQSLSNTFENRTTTHRGGISLRKRLDNLMLTVGANLQDVTLTGDQTFPTTFDVKKNFQDVLPNLMLQYSFARSHNLRFFYRTSTRVPSISQLQDVINNSNPLQLSSGNPDLTQSYMHTLVLRYNRTIPGKGYVLMGNVSVSQTSNHIGSKTFLTEETTVLDNGVELVPGSQFSQPYNVDGYWNARSFFTFGMPSSALKSNINLNGGYTYSRTPGFINELENISDVHNVNIGAVIGSNISERVDFTLSYSLNKSIVKNSVYSETDNNYVFHRSALKINLLPWNSVVFETSVGFTEYVGLGEDFDSNSVMWNAGVGYKFLKGNGGEIKLMVADILNQQNALVRTVNEFYVEDNLSNVLGRYLILNFTYTLRNFRI